MTKTESQPPIPYGRPWVDETDRDAVREILEGNWLTTGPVVPRFEEALADYAGVARAVAVSSGTAALHTAYHALRLGAEQNLVTSPLTFMATASAALQLGATVRFADVEADYGTLDPRAIGETLGEDTTVLAPVDFAGQPCDYEGLRSAAAKVDPAIVADACHSLGASQNGKAVGSLADLTVTSFHPVKTITSAEGGVVFTRDSELASRMERFRNHGIERAPSSSPEPWTYEIRELGLNYRLSDLHAALGLSQLRRLPSFVDRRRNVAERYQAAFRNIPGLRCPSERRGAKSAWHLYVLRAPDREARASLFHRLRERGIGSQVHYPALHLQPALKDLGYAAGDFPAAEDWAGCGLSIPLFPAMSDAEVDRVIEAVLESARELW